ncbi:primase-like DNA-binding domain-containing protein [Burkholderia glumae]
MRLQKRGSFDPVLPKAMSSALHSARIETNSVKAWCAEDEVSCEGVPRLPKSDVYDSYVSWCRDNGAAAIGQTQFWIRIRDTFPQYIEHKIRRDDRSFRTCNLCVGPA